MKTKDVASVPQKTDEESRREFLVKAGKMALYIPPAMMLLMHPSRKAFACNESLSVRQGSYFGRGNHDGGNHGGGSHGGGNHGGLK